MKKILILTILLFIGFVSFNNKTTAKLLKNAVNWELINENSAARTYIDSNSVLKKYRNSELYYDFKLKTEPVNKDEFVKADIIENELLEDVGIDNFGYDVAEYRINYIRQDILFMGAKGYDKNGELIYATNGDKTPSLIEKDTIADVVYQKLSRLK